jgi:hypothetical protein
VGEIEIRLHSIEVDPRVGTLVTLAVVRDGQLLGTHGAVVVRSAWRPSPTSAVATT